MPQSESLLVESLAKWMLEEHSRFHGLKRVPADQRQAIEERAKTIIESSEKRKEKLFAC